MKIVILDGHTTNPGDLSWGGLEALGMCTVYDRTTPDAIAERVGDAPVLLTNKTHISAETLTQLPDLAYIGLLSTGVNVVDLGAARQRGVVVTNVPAYSTSSVAQLVFAHILALMNRVELHAHSVSSGEWCAAPDFCYWQTPQGELAGRTMGLVGFGQIGKRVAALAKAFEMRVRVHTRNARESMAGVEFVGLDDLFRSADVLSLHCPLTPQTHHLVDSKRLSLMKSSAILINTGRGDLIDEAALARALNTGQLAGAGLDVLSSEPPLPTNPLLTARACLITPHIAWATKAARARLIHTVTANLRAFLAGAPQNVVNGPPPEAVCGQR